MEPATPAKYEAGNRPGHNSALTVTEALTLLAYGKRETWGELIRRVQDFIQHWRFTPPAVEVLRLLEARGAPEPYYPWHPVMSHDGKRVRNYDSEYAAPSRWVEGQSGPFRLGAPELARATRAQHRRRLGRLVTYAELAAMLRAELDEYRDRAARWDKANAQLREAILNGQIVVWAVRADDPKQEHVILPSQVAFRAIQFREDQVEPDDSAPNADFMAILNGTRWTQLRVRFADLQGLRAMDDDLRALDTPDVNPPASALPPCLPEAGYVSAWGAVAWRAFSAWSIPAHVGRHRSFDGGTDRLPDETGAQHAIRLSEHRRFDVAERELLDLLASGQVTAEGQLPARAASGEQLHVPEPKPTVIPANTFLNRQLAFDGNGNLVQRLPVLEREFPAYELHGSTADPSFPLYYSVLIEAGGLRRAWEPTAVQPEPLPKPSYKTGVQGRPSSKHLVEAEMRRRFVANRLQLTLSAEVAALIAWLVAEHPGAAIMTPKTAENALRHLYREMMRPKNQPPK